MIKLTSVENDDCRALPDGGYHRKLKHPTVIGDNNFVQLDIEPDSRMGRVKL